MELSWTETGGALVEQPKRRGFGSTLIERALAMETGGRAVVHYLRADVVCDIFLPASSVAYFDATARDGAKAQAAGRLIAEAPNAASLETFRVLVVEDSFLLVMSIQAMFDGLGWKAVGPAPRKVEALALARSGTFDAALLDVNLDGEMSWDVAAVLKARGIPFVFGTGYDVANVPPDDLAGTAVFGKPYHSKAVEQRLREVMAVKGHARSQHG